MSKTFHMCLFSLILLPSAVLQAQTDLGVANYTADNVLIYPDNLDEWIHLGSTMGGDYAEETFDAAHPGTLGVVLMEPHAYKYFKANGDYANGTMLLLSFYQSEVKSDPQLQGFVQGDMRAQEIHVIDPVRYAEGSAFFVYPNTTVATVMPEGSECIQCHTQEGDFRSTFIQFYPTIRNMSRK